MFRLCSTSLDTVERMVEKGLAISYIHKLFWSRLSRERPETSTATTSEDNMIGKHVEIIGKR